MKNVYWKFNKILVFLILIFAVFIFCFDRLNKDNITVAFVNEWIGREIKMPNNYQCNLLGTDTANVSTILLDSEYKILLYVDSAGCMGCKLQLPRWDMMIKEFEYMSLNKPAFLLFFHQKNEKELSLLLKRENFNYPVFIDTKGEMGQLNNFPPQPDFQCFLLDRNNKVLLVGNPVKNIMIKELYVKTILNQEIVLNSDKQQSIQTEVSVDDAFISLGKFDWTQEQNAMFTLINTGTNPLVVDDVSTSCGCTSVEYSQKPVRPGDSVSLHVTYKAEHPEHFDKTITVYCNAKPSPVVLRITGDAE
ncbi:DUF1573 domain-containing protein [Bacteroides sp. UBA939]|uniref:DUF1573 domain-containing protein n=1 Tax=Bacteroides sp. UBA939 TaxID=1946092 RepID=UPI0025B9A5B0|nr:DUF1573 domain-containing protein [Bacteroides sp. UBA939]